MPRNNRKLLCGTSSLPAPPDIMGSAEDGNKGRSLLWVGVSGIQGHDTGGPAISHHIQRGGECGGVILGRSYFGERGRVEQARTRGETPKFHLLHG